MKLLLFVVFLTWSKSYGQGVALTLEGPEQAVNQGIQYILNCVASTEDAVSGLSLRINGQMIGGFIFGGFPNRTTVNYFNPAISAANNGQVAQCHYRNVSSNHVVISVVDGVESSIALNASPQNVIRNKNFTINCTVNSTLSADNITLRINGNPISDSRVSTQSTSSFTLFAINDIDGAVAQCTVGDLGSNPFVINVMEQDCENTGQFECEQNCTNIPGGGFTCSCNTGFTNISSTQCQDINECSLNNGGCEHECINNNGSRTCACSEGFQLRNDGESCEDIDDCLIDNGGCDQMCVNVIGSQRACVCREGFTLINDGTSCRGSGISQGALGGIVAVVALFLILVVVFILFVCFMCKNIKQKRKINQLLKVELQEFGERNQELQQKMKKFKELKDTMNSALTELGIRNEKASSTTIGEFEYSLNCLLTELDNKNKQASSNPKGSRKKIKTKELRRKSKEAEQPHRKPQQQSPLVTTAQVHLPQCPVSVESSPKLKETKIDEGSPASVQTTDGGRPSSEKSPLLQTTAEVGPSNKKPALDQEKHEMTSKQSAKDQEKHEMTSKEAELKLEDYNNEADTSSV